MNSESIRKQLAEAKATLWATPEAQKVKELEEAYLKAFKAEEEEQTAKAAEEFAKNKETLIKAGFECRTGHTTSATNHHDRTSPNGEPYTYIILRKKLPKIEHINEWSSGASVNFYSVEKSYDFDEIGLGNGETEQEAWESAVEEYLYDADNLSIYLSQLD